MVTKTHVPHNIIFRLRGENQHPAQCGDWACHLVWCPPPAPHWGGLPHLQDVEHRQERHQEGLQPGVRHRLRGGKG